MSEEKRYQVALGLIPGVGDQLAKQLVSYCGSAKAIFSTPTSKLQKIPGIGSKRILDISLENRLKDADRIIEACSKQDIQILFYTDKAYPSRLKAIADSPSLLYFKGNGDLNATRTVGIVGTRKATDYGKEVVDQLCAELASVGIVTISGLAYGIDIHSHRSSLKNQIPTFGVLAGGLDKVYPAVHKSTCEQMVERGGLLSENALGTKPEAHLFPARNRIIAGLSDALIVVEAAEKGGALITADIAYTYHKDVFAVPGNITNTYSKGCHDLITSQRAIPYTKIKDLLYNMNWDLGTGEPAPPKIRLDDYEEPDRSILEALSQEKEGLQIDQLAWKTQVPLNKLASKLLELEFAGIVKTLPGKRYKLC